MARILKPTVDAIAQAAARLRAGDVVGFPTETVYGLGADTFKAAALRRVYELKGRPAHNPLIAHVLASLQARTVVAHWDDRCDEVARRFWPGPLTLVLPKKGEVPDLATAGLATIAVRAPSHPIARKLLEAFGGTISAPSANRSGHVSPTTAQHVAGDFADVDDLIVLDGGPCEVGIESTVLDLSGVTPRILRPGSVTVEQLREVLGEVESPQLDEQAASPGTSAMHYAPRTPAELVASNELSQRLSQMPSRTVVLGFDAVHVQPPHIAIVMPRDDREYAQRLYDALRQADASGCARILIEKPPTDTAIWRAIHDRLRRATV